MASHPKNAEEITKLLLKYCTSGNVVALGMESADPEVIKRNNLNATPREVMAAVEMLNRYGRERGPNGMPYLLPGLNFLGGLRGETKHTYEHNISFLISLRKKGLWLRRINIRQVLPVRDHFKVQNMAAFKRFKSFVRQEIEQPLLKEMFPMGTVLRDVYLELQKGNTTYGRQIGSYPLLIGIPYPLPTNTFIDVSVVDYGYRSLTGVQYPLDVNKACLRALTSLPQIGAKRAVRIIRHRPFTSKEEVIEALDCKDAGQSILPYITVGDEHSIKK